MIEKSQRLHVRDLATIGIFSVLVPIVQTILGLITLPLSPFSVFSFVFFTGPIALICAPIFMVMVAKVGKPGAVLLFNLIRGLLFVLFGAPVLLVLFLVGGLLAELVLIGKDSFQSFFKISLSWMISSIAYSLHLVFMYMLFRPAFAAMMGEETVSKVSEYLSSPLWIGTTLVTTIVCVIIGCFLSQHLMHKHFTKAGILQ